LYINRVVEILIRLAAAAQRAAGGLPVRGDVPAERKRWVDTGKCFGGQGARLLEGRERGGKIRIACIDLRLQSVELRITERAPPCPARCRICRLRHLHGACLLIRSIHMHHRNVIVRRQIAPGE
jgi:hypothetical protein